MKTILVSKEHYYSLDEDDHGNLFLRVMCGTIGMYAVSFKLNEIELESYQQQGAAALTQLAKQVTANPKLFLQRNNS